MGIFKIDADKFQWINGIEDDPNDLCLHGHVMVQVGMNFFDDVGTVANADLSEVTISGCDTGTDWSIIHSDGGIKIVLPSGVEEQVDFSDYKAEVFRFVDKIEACYKSCQPKNIPEDEFCRNGYVAFWNEWHRHRKE